jgi:hypothetical protein
VVVVPDAPVLEPDPPAPEPLLEDIEEDEEDIEDELDEEEALLPDVVVDDPPLELAVEPAVDPPADFDEDDAPAFFLVFDLLLAPESDP